MRGRLFPLRGLWITWLFLAGTLTWAATAGPPAETPPAGVVLAAAAAEPPLAAAARGGTLRDGLPLLDAMVRRLLAGDDDAVEGTVARAMAPRFPASLVFPVVGPHRFGHSFGDPRGGSRRHAGEDIFAAKMTPVVAVADGVVRWIHDGQLCCALALDHPGGWQTRYVHLNNDTPGTDDGRGRGIAPGLEVGRPVAAGELVGWVGDSGNAEHTPAHLHFELRRSGEPVDSHPWLETASAALTPPSSFSPSSAAAPRTPRRSSPRATG